MAKMVYLAVGSWDFPKNFSFHIHEKSPCVSLGWKEDKEKERYKHQTERQMRISEPFVSILQSLQIIKRKDWKRAHASLIPQCGSLSVSGEKREQIVNKILSKWKNNKELLLQSVTLQWRNQTAKMCNEIVIVWGRALNLHRDQQFVHTSGCHRWIGHEPGRNGWHCDLEIPGWDQDPAHLVKEVHYLCQIRCAQWPLRVIKPTPAGQYKRVTKRGAAAPKNKIKILINIGLAGLWEENEITIDIGPAGVSEEIRFPLT